MARFRHDPEKILKNRGRIGTAEEAAMTNIPLFPRPVSWLSAVAVFLYVFLGRWVAFLSQVTPRVDPLIDAMTQRAKRGEA